MELVKYDAACRAVAEIKTIDEVKETCSQAEAIKAYARQAKNRQLELDAMEIRVRAERKGGEILIAMKEANVLRPQGVRDHTDRGQAQVRLSDLGIDGDDSGKYQRLAKLPLDRFEGRLSNWRSEAETAPRPKMPLQDIRNPSLSGDIARQTHRQGRFRVSIDPHDRFRSIDGRRVVDWRAGELDRLDQLATRMSAAVAALRKAMPIANPDPLETMEMIFTERGSLIEVLGPIWDAPVVTCDTGVYPSEFKLGKKLTCQHCGVLFKPSSGLHRRDAGSGKYCSRSCAGKARWKQKCGT